MRIKITDKAVFKFGLSSAYTIVLAFILVASFALIMSCTTSTYGKGFLRDELVSDQYNIKIYVGGFSGPETADKRVEKEINDFMTQNGYESYQIVKRKYNFIPSYYEYDILFSKKRK